MRLGAKVSSAHRCICGDQANSQGHHDLSCKKSAGRKSRHAALNSIIKRAFASGTESILEPVGVAMSDGKRSDGLTLSPWERGRCLAWDATCVCTLALSHLAATTSNVGAAAAEAERKKVEKYRDIVPDYLFVPVGIETFGPWGPEATSLLNQLGRKIRQVTGERRSMEYLRQRFSIEVQRGDAASVLGTVPPSANLDEIFFLNKSNGKQISHLR